MNLLEQNLPELEDLQRAIALLGTHARVEQLNQITHKGINFPLYAISIGSKNPKSNTLGLFGGIHGLERIGTRILISYLKTLAELLKWDEITQHFLESTRLVFMPLINPVGMFLGQRSNGNGVDLMRNSPIETERYRPWEIFKGHRLSKRLPWYRGEINAPMEKEAQAVCEFVYREIFPANVSITLDVHSGYGTVDRLWFPYAYTSKPFSRISEVYLLKSLLDKTYPNHVYCFEPQSKQYTTHGDLWDYLFSQHEKNSDTVYIPLSLELGSWLWVKKNPRQLFSLKGAFNPLKRHRYKRILRRHLVLLEFLQRAVCSATAWAQINSNTKNEAKIAALKLWYEN